MAPADPNWANDKCCLITHRLASVRKADRIYVLHQGRVVESGVHDELVSLPNGHYAQLYRIQADQYAD